MKKALLLRLPQKAVDRIQAGKQRFIMRRTSPRQAFNRILIFVDPTKPILVMECLPGQTYYANMGELAKHFRRPSGMQPAEWNAYFCGKHEGCAIEIAHHVEVPAALAFDLVEFYALRQPPQNFCYVPCPSWGLGRPVIPKQSELGELFAAAQ